MSIDKQIEELAKDLFEEIEYDTLEHYYSYDCSWTEVKFDYTKTAEHIIDKGYRKASDVAREIFEEIEDIRLEHSYGEIDGNELNVKLFNLKKKYESEVK